MNAAECFSTDSACRSASYLQDSVPVLWAKTCLLTVLAGAYCKSKSFAISGPECTDMSPANFEREECTHIVLIMFQCFRNQSPGKVYLANLIPACVNVMTSIPIMVTDGQALDYCATVTSCTISLTS